MQHHLTSSGTGVPAPCGRQRQTDLLQQEIWLHVRERYETLRRVEGLTQVGLAAAVGVTPTQICVWLGDPRRMTLKAAARLLAAMGSRLRCVREDDVAAEVEG